MGKQSNIPGLFGRDWAARAWLAWWLFVAVLGMLAFCQEAFWHVRAEGWFGRHLMMLPFTSGLVASVGAIFWVPWVIDRRRTNALASAANDLGMKFTAHPASEKLAAFSKLSAFRVGSAASLHNLMVGRFGGVHVLLVDCYCKVGPGSRSAWPKSHRAYRSKTTVVIFPNASGCLPKFMLIPRVRLKSRASVMDLMLKSYPDLEIGKQPAHPFASHYRVAGSDGKAVADLLTHQVMDFFAEHENWNVEVLDHHVAVYRMDRLVKGKDCRKRLGNALLVLKALTQRSLTVEGFKDFRSSCS
jgi:hypothetical protein